MITKITAINWKSFEKLEYKFQSLNILLGNNSSGKSNFLDLLEFISKVAKGTSNEELNKIRGGIDYFRRIEAKESSFDIEIKVNEVLVVIDSVNNEIFFKIEGEKEELFNEASKILKNLEQQLNKVKQLSGMKNSVSKAEKTFVELSEKIEEYNQNKNRILESLKNIVVIDPTPSLIRGTAKHENRELLKDCSNLRSFVAGMEEQEKIKIENKLVDYLKKLTFSEIQSVKFKFTGENKESAQLYIEENGIKLHSDIISDGMLRFISIIVALMTQKTGGILAIEEIDNGIAPYQLKMLMDIVDEISAERQFDVVFTTHNHLLINYLGEEYMDFVFYVSKKDGKSNIKRIKDYPQYGKLSSYGKLGDLVDNEEVINILNAQGDVDEA